jgi:molecular chaperone GrpE
VDGANDETAPRAASDGDAPQPPEAEAETADGELSEAEPADPALAALEQRAAKAEEYLALAQRTKADFENYRKRAIREAAMAQERGVAKLAKELLPAVDNLDRALTAAQSAADAAGEGDEVHAQLLSGIQLVHADVISALQRAGIEAFSPEGEAFDPQWHEAVAQAPVPDAQSGCVVEVYQRGYRLGESVLRPARVLVAA